MAEITTIQPIKKPCRKIRCGAYCRVSTGSAEQLHSYAAQRVWFSNLLNRSQTEVLVDIYADVGISGTTAERPEFMRMLDDCRRGRIDRILTKSISRFARNTRDCLAILRELREMDVTVFFEKENIDTARSADEMMIAIIGGLAQEESQSISRNIRWSLHRKMAAGTLGVARVPYGYDKVNGRLVINDEQAAVVRRIFSLYLSGSGTRRIAALFNSEGLPAPESAAWNNITIYKMLSQEMYLGDIRWQKTVSVFMGKSSPNTGQADSFYVSGSHDPIIDRSTFESAQTLRLKNACPAEKTNDSPFRKKIVCGICGRSYYLVGAANAYWQCTGRFDLVKPCTNEILHDETLFGLWRVISSKLTNHADDILLSLIEQLERIAEKVSENAESGRLDEILQHKLTLRKMCAEGLISYGEVIDSETKLNAEYAALTEKRWKRAEHNALLINDLRTLYKAVSAVKNDRGTDILHAVRFAHDTSDFELMGGIHITMSIPRREKREISAHEPITAVRLLALCGGCGGRLSRRKIEGVYLWKCSNRYCSYWRTKHTDEDMISRTTDVFSRVCADPRLIRLKCCVTEYRPTERVLIMQNGLENLITSGGNAEILTKAAVNLAEEKILCIEYNVKTEQTAQIEETIKKCAELPEFLMRTVKHIYVTPDRVRVKFINGKTVRSERSKHHE